VLRLADREGDRLGRRPPVRDRSRRARTRRARGGRRPDDARGCARHPRHGRVRERRLLHGVPRATLRGGSVVSRRAARRSALFALYKWDLTGELELEDRADEYTRELVDRVTARAGELDERITASAQGWTADRLGVVERNILRIAIEEIESEAVPFEVA